MALNPTEVVTPNFYVWQQETLARFATETYARMRELEEANEQLRLDLKDAMNLLRNQHKTHP
jgi:hypothetical protein